MQSVQHPGRPRHVHCSTPVLNCTLYHDRSAATQRIETICKDSHPRAFPIRSPPILVESHHVGSQDGQSTTFGIMYSVNYCDKVRVFMGWPLGEC